MDTRSKVFLIIIVLIFPAGWGIWTLIDRVQHTQDAGRELFFMMIESTSSERTFEAFADRYFCPVLREANENLEGKHDELRLLIESYSVGDIEKIRFIQRSITGKNENKVASMKGVMHMRNGTGGDITLKLCREEDEWKLLEVLLFQ